MAKTQTLKAETRNRTGSGVLKQMRREGYIPSVVYGKGSETINIKVNTKASNRYAGSQCFGKYPCGS
jgi:large subunit ribosomal protein L25